MKRSALALLLTLLLGLPVSGALSPIRVNVEVSSDSDAKKIGSSGSGRNRSTGTAYTQNRTLNITVQNLSSESFSDLVVKYWFFGHDARSHDSRPLKHGQKMASIGPRGREIVRSETISMKYTPEHVEIENRNNRNRGRGRASAPTQRRVPASGTKLTGYAVQVLNGTAVVAEKFSEDSYKAKIAMGTPPAKNPKQGKKAASKPNKAKRK